MIERLRNWLVEWWERPSPRWLQQSAIWAFPLLALLIAFVAGGFWTLVSPYTGANTHLSPGSPNDTVEYAVFRTLAGGGIAAISLFVWWKKIRRP